MQKAFINKSKLMYSTSNGDSPKSSLSEQRIHENYLYNDISDYDIEDSLKSFMIVNDITEIEDTPISNTEQNNNIFAQLSMSFYDRKALTPNPKFQL